VTSPGFNAAPFVEMFVAAGEKKPSLIVLDEIDGIEGGPNGGIAELVKMIKATASLMPKKGESLILTYTNQQDSLFHHRLTRCVPDCSTQ
jgi:hypothetical protein